MTTSKLPLVDHQHDALQIIHLLGGQKNIKQIFSCMTRLRILVYNDNLIDKQQLANYGKLINSGHQLQIFMGSGIAQIYEQAVNHNLNSLSSNTQAENNSSMEPTQSVSDNTDNWQTNKANSKAKYNLRISHILSKFGNIFVPLLPALIAAGLVGGIANFIQNYHTAHHLTLPIYYHVLKLVNNAFFAYFLIFVGINAAKEFGASSTLGGMVAGICLMPGLSPEIKQILNVHASSGGVFGLLFACWLLAYLEKYLNKIVPASLQILFTPPIAMIIIALFLILAIIPLDNILTSYMVLGIDKLLQGAPILAGYILVPFYH
jgi:PTS system sucrose-specific IIC component